MTEERPSRVPPLKLVATDAPSYRSRSGVLSDDPAKPVVRDVDWTILMARAQEGDGAAYRRLLEEVTPYLGALAARWHRDANDVEDAVQDVLLTVHSIRHAYDPARPFGPWLAAIANRRFVDRVRRQGRVRARETPLTIEHETFSGPPANIE